ncbi:MAG: thioesterase family protein [Bacteroidales bacterium]|nr:thioesterase family protein [Bacteroidales bacterium]
MKIGSEYTCNTQVAPANCASAVGSGGLDVFSTPSMIALMEKAAFTLVQESLAEGESTVGTQMNVDHVKASKIGDTITAKAVLTAIDGRKLTFDVSATDSAGNTIGHGVHTRFIIQIEKFLSRL